MPRLIWIDIESTGLNEYVDRIMEVAMIATNDAMEAEVPYFQESVKLPEKDLADLLHRGPEDPVLLMHTASGLIDECQKVGLPNLSVLRRRMDEWLEPWLLEDEPPWWAGSGCDFDRRFLHRLRWPGIDRMSHRTFEMQSFRFMFEQWAPHLGLHERPREMPHRALDDLELAIEMAFKMREWLVWHKLEV